MKNKSSNSRYRLQIPVNSPSLTVSLARWGACRGLYNITKDYQVDPEQGLDSQIQECLTRLGISSPVEWDVLAFVHRHHASLVNTEQISRMVGYPGAAVADALDHLESLKLIQRSRASRGVQFYQLVSSEAGALSRDCFPELIALAATPAARLLLLKKLRQHGAGVSFANVEGRDG